MVVEKDLFDIADRLKEIDPQYFVVFNEKKCKYELHSHLLRPTYVLTFPYRVLDARAIEHTLKTRVANLDRLVKEIEEHNLKLEKQETEKGLERIYGEIDKAACKIL